MDVCWSDIGKALGEEQEERAVVPAEADHLRHPFNANQSYSMKGTEQMETVRR